MAKVITFSRVYPAHHPRKGEPTFFVEKLIEGFKQLGLTIPKNELVTKPFIRSLNFEKFDPKWHTIREGQRFKAGDWFSPRCWEGKPYNSKQIILCEDVQVKKTWDFNLTKDTFYINGNALHENSWEYINQFIKNDGFINIGDFTHWFKEGFEGQIICWNEKIQY